MDASEYAFVHGIRSTRGALLEWRRRPWPVLSGWFVGSLGVAMLLLTAVWVIASVTVTHGLVDLDQPPFSPGGFGQVLEILSRNLPVLALHAMACVAGFIAGSSLPLQASRQTGVARLVHERGRPIALGFVVCATTFSLSMQSYALGTAVAGVAATVHASPGLVLLGLLPHAVLELVALFLPLAAWLIASRRGEWDRLLAATCVTVLLALPLLLLAALWEVYAAPHLLPGLLGYS
jgi:hypothetical protein